MNSKSNPVQFKPVAQRKIYQSILEQFVRMVSSGELKPGDKIPSERELAVAFNVSRPSVREALRVLEIIGLIDVQSGGGAYLKEMELGPFISVVAPLLFSRDNFDLELLEFRETIEVRATELLAHTMTETDLNHMKTALEAMEQAVAMNDPETGAMADIAFHRSLLEASRSYILQKVMELVVSLFEHAVRGGRSIVLERHEDARQLYIDHLNIYTALYERDFSKAKALVTSHLQMVRQLYGKR
jgi:GntR family transcriptional repressor for pyruvate dehydrogenase complex